ncbi:hybrid signal transduction histidine kinase M [Tanacetum coccineum]
MKACDVWKNLKDVFHDNKDARAMQLDNDLSNLSIGNHSITQYFTKIKDMADLLANIEPPLSEKNLVTYAVNGLVNKFAHVANIIRHRDPFPTFDTARSMLLVEESILNRETNANSLGSSSSPSVLVVTTKGNSEDLCRNFIRGTCRFGDRCRFVHGKHSHKPTDGLKLQSHSKSNAKSVNGTSINTGNMPIYTSAAAFGPTGPPVPTGFCYAPSGPRNEYGPEVMYTTLPKAFNTMTLQEGGIEC